MSENTSIVNKKVRQSNHFVESPYAQEFSAHEIKIFEIGIANIKQSDKYLFDNRSNKRFILTASQLALLLNTSVSSISHEIEKTANRIMKKTLHLRKKLDDGTIEFQMINIVPFAEYKNGVFQFDINYAVIPYILEVEQNFTEFQLKYLLTLRSAYAIKLYKLIYRYINLKSRHTFSIDDLKKQFGVSDKYPLYKNFKQKILVPAIDQINNLTDIHIDYNEVKLGRRVNELIFTFKIIRNLTSVESVSVDKETDNMLVKSGECWNDFIDFYYKSYGQIKSYHIINEFNKLSQDKILKIYKKNKFEAVVLARYVLDKAKQDVNSYLIRHGVNGVSYINQKDVEKLKNKAEAKLFAENLKIKQKQEENKEHKEKNDIKHEFYKLVDSEKDKYINHAEFMCKKHKLNLIFKNKSNEDIAFSVYAVSNNKKYAYAFEKYCKDNSINLSIYK